MTWEITPEIEEEIITALENGIGLLVWCRGEGRPSRSTILRYQEKNPTFDAKCARAREAAGYLAFERHQETIDKTIAGDISPEVSRVVLNGLQWEAIKGAPRAYGEKQTILGDPSQPQVHKHSLEVSFVGNANRDTTSV